MLRQYGYAAFGQLAQALLGLAGLIISTRALGPAQYGIFLVIGTTLTLLTIAIAAGPTAAVLVLGARNPSGRASLHGQVTVAAVALALLTVLLTPLAAPWLSSLVSGGISPALAALAVVRLPALVYATLAISLLSGAGYVGRAALLGATNATLSLLGLLPALVADDGLAAIIIGTTAAATAAALITGIVTSTAIGLAPLSSGSSWRALVQIAVPMHLGTVAYWVMLRADALAVNSLLGAASAGVYGLALQLSERVSLVTTPVYNATAWRVSGSSAKDALDVTLRVARIEIAVGVCAGLAAWLLGPWLAILIGGPQFAAAAGPLAVLVLGAAMLPVWSVVGLFLVSHHRGAWPTTIVQIAMGGVAVAGYWTVTPLLGPIGAAIVSTGTYLMLVVVGLSLIYRREPFSPRDVLLTREDIVLMLRSVKRLLRRRQATSVGRMGDG